MTAPLPSPTRRETDDELDHLTCCDDDLALCGSDVTEASLVSFDESPNQCVVCADLREQPCREGCDW